MFEHLEHPYAWLDLNALDENIRFVNENCKNKKIRIATKSIRSVEVLKYIEKNLIHFAGYMTFTAQETVYLLEQGFNHLLLGYPVMESLSVKKCLLATKEGKDVVFMVDCEQHLRFLQKLAEEVDSLANVCIDLNVSNDYKWIYFGSKRSPIQTANKLMQFLQIIKKYNRINVVGVMAYDAQIAGVTDRFDNPLKSILVEKLKINSKKTVRSLRKHFVHIVKKEWPLSFVNAGGSGSMQYCANQNDVTEITVGSAFFAPALFDRYDSLKLKPAAGFALRVVRQFDDETFVLHGGGYIASGVIGKDKQPVFIEQNRFQFLDLEGAGEVQTPIIDKLKKLQVGDSVKLRHAKAGELCERFLALHTFRGEQYLGPITTYRGDGKCFL